MGKSGCCWIRIRCGRTEQRRFQAWRSAGTASIWRIRSPRLARTGRSGKFDIATGKDLSDLVQWTKFTGAEWTTDNTGFYYMRYPEPNANATLKAANTGAKIYLHHLGQPQSADKLIYEDAKHPDRLYSPTLSED